MRYVHLAALAARTFFGGMMLMHGYPKLEKLLSGSTSFADPIGLGEMPTLILAVLAEFVCPILIIVGFKTRMASILPFFTMAVAAFIVHADDPWKKQEFALLYFTGFLIIFLLDSGKYSVDHLLSKP